MKKYFLLLICTIVFNTLCGQSRPHWLNNTFRETSYPKDNYFTGLAEGDLLPNENIASGLNRIKKEAQQTLSEEIYIKIESNIYQQNRSIRSNTSEQIDAFFKSDLSTTSNTEIVGIKIESYYDELSKSVHAFAYVKKQDLINYYKNTISYNITQIEGGFQIVTGLEQIKEKIKAQQEYQKMEILFSKIKYAQEMLLLLANHPDEELLQISKIKELENKMLQGVLRLEQSKCLFVESTENIFDKESSLVANKTKSLLGKYGYSYTENIQNADYTLRINATVRKMGDENGITICYADVIFSLINNENKKTIYTNEISEKGFSLSEEQAGRNAYEKAAGTIVQMLLDKLN